MAQLPLRRILLLFMESLRLTHQVILLLFAELICNWDLLNYASKIGTIFGRLLIIQENWGWTSITDSINWLISFTRLMRWTIILKLLMKLTDGLRLELLVKLNDFNLVKKCFLCESNILGFKLLNFNNEYRILKIIQLSRF